MSWTGGSRIFASVSDAILERETDQISEKDLFKALITALKNEGWDVAEAEVGGFDEDSPVREALREFGVVEICGAEHEAEPWQCEEENGHYPATRHKNYQGHTWKEI